MKDYTIINREDVLPISIKAGKVVKAIDFDEEVLYDVHEMQISEFMKLYEKPNVIFVVRGTV